MIKRISNSTKKWPQILCLIGSVAILIAVMLFFTAAFLPLKVLCVVLAVAALFVAMFNAWALIEKRSTLSLLV